MIRKQRNSSTDSKLAPAPSDWPGAGLERVPNCPICDSSQCAAGHIGLTDSVYFTAPGVWDLYQCSSCGCAYLDPRPTQETIGLAYQNYYTHRSGQRADSASLSRALRLRRALANGYRNWRYGTHYQPSSRMGIAMALAFPQRRRSLDRAFRSLPRPAPGSRLLDVGFGSGAFLESARDAGWQVAGVELDPVAVDAALQRGLDVRKGGIEAYLGIPGRFDIITMDQVIEHVYDPRATLQAGYRLLKPGGLLWLSTPNIQSLGHAHYGRNWRGLEPPRHLVIFNWPSMLKLLRDIGFSSIAREEEPAFATMAAKSEAIATGRGCVESPPIRLRHRLRGALARGITYFQPDRTEFITLRARKPATDE